MNMWFLTSEALGTDGTEVCVEVDSVWYMEGRNTECKAGLSLNKRESKTKAEDWNIV